MRSSDLARLAGVTVRTLRHYHQIGLIPEPERSANGYRTYTAADLVRLLRVRRLTDLGMPLSRIDPTVDTEDELALLDREYARQIEEPQHRRAAINALRQSAERVDTPAFAQEYTTELNQRDGVAAQPVQAERDAALLLELFLDSNSTARLMVLNEAEIAELADVSTGLLTLPDDAPEADTDAVADALASVLRRLQPVFSRSSLTRETAKSVETMSMTNSHQLSRKPSAAQCDACHVDHHHHNCALSREAPAPHNRHQQHALGQELKSNCRRCRRHFVVPTETLCRNEPTPWTAQIGLRFWQAANTWSSTPAKNDRLRQRWTCGWAGLGLVVARDGVAVPRRILIGPSGDRVSCVSFDKVEIDGAADCGAVAHAHGNVGIGGCGIADCPDLAMCCASTLVDREKARFGPGKALG